MFGQLVLVVTVALAACDSRSVPASRGGVSRTIHVGTFETSPGPMHARVDFEAREHGLISVGATSEGQMAACVVSPKDATKWTARTRQLFDSVVAQRDPREVFRLDGPTMPNCDMKLMRESQRGEPYTTLWMQTTNESAPVIITVSPRQARHILALMDSSIQVAK